MADDLSIFGGLPGGVDEDRLRAARRKLRLRNAFEPEGPLPPRPSASGVGGKGVTPGPPPAVPANTVAPAVTGTAAVGSTLSCSTGTWTRSPTSYSYSWISGSTQVGTAATYVIQAGDLGNNIFCRVQARNAAGFGTPATSNTVGPVTAAPPTSTWSTADAAAGGITLSNGGLTASISTALSTWAVIRGTIGKSSGKLYIEFLTGAGGASFMMADGLASATITLNGELGSNNYSCGVRMYNGPIAPKVSTGFTANYNCGANVSFPPAGDVLALAVDFSAGSIWYARNNVWENGSNPATGSLPAVSFVPATVGALFPSLSLLYGPATWILQPTAASQKYAPPSGFTAWG